MGFSNAPLLRAATPFKMPAMSPTMTEGNIGTWKVKEGVLTHPPSISQANEVGGSFEAGDVLLEIETDKAQMDVEAQDSGILAKILVPDGTQKVNVGKMIAVLAEEGDDISSIEMPSEEEDSNAAASSKETAEKPKDEATQETEKSTNHKVSINADVTLSPSVLRLLHEHGISDPKTITATGPQGRLLKGDVLVHVGTVKSQMIKDLEGILAKKQKLDLDNIVVQKPAEKPSKPTATDLPPTPPPFASIATNIKATDLLRAQKRYSGLFFHTTVL
jgi:pyruvate/2-oxoglutarate dehydrogenase complex dihydrolipoamide acyltransferase (E2) component